MDLFKVTEFKFFVGLDIFYLDFGLFGETPFKSISIDAFYFLGDATDALIGCTGTAGFTLVFFATYEFSLIGVFLGLSNSFITSSYSS